jgi:Domain of unknown function (DUF1830)
MMLPFSSPIPDHQPKCLCCYQNPSRQTQVARITNVPNWHFERVIFPGQTLLFEAVSDGILEVYAPSQAGPLLHNQIACDRLKVSEIEPVTNEYPD